jgi:hypothetical protein
MADCLGADFVARSVGFGQIDKRSTLLDSDDDCLGAERFSTRRSWVMGRSAILHSPADPDPPAIDTRIGHRGNDA